MAALSRPAGLRPAALAPVARRPDLWPIALRTVWRLAPRGWWRRPPFLPLPAPDYLRFRLQTMYGDVGHPVAGSDLVDWLTWCRAMENTVR